MSQGDTKDLANLVAANLLDHYLESLQTELANLGKALDDTDLDISLQTEDLKKHLNGLRTIMAKLSGGRKMRRILVDRVSKMRDQLDEDDQYVPYTKTCIRNVNKAIDFAITEHFGRKEEVLLDAFVAVLSKFDIVKLKSMVPSKFYDMVQQMKEGDDGI